MPFETSPLPEGTVVTATFEKGSMVGYIRGHSGEVAGIGYMYIVEVFSKSGAMWDNYPYSCVYLSKACFQTADVPPPGVS